MRATDIEPKPNQASGMDVNDHIEVIYHYIFANGLGEEGYVVKVVE